MLTPIAAWLLVLMTALLPAEQGAVVPTPSDNRETATERASRYEGIADAIAAIAYDPAELPVFSGPDGRAKTAALLLSISYWESGGWNKVVDFGIAPRGIGDHGTSHCLAQVRLSPGMRTRHGFSARDLVEDRRACFRAALAIVRDSFRSCARSTPLDRKLAVYTSGKCNAGLRESRLRMRTALGLYEAYAPPGEDRAFIREAEDVLPVRATATSLD